MYGVGVTTELELRLELEDVFTDDEALEVEVVVGFAGAVLDEVVEALLELTGAVPELVGLLELTGAVPELVGLLEVTGAVPELVGLVGLTGAVPELVGLLVETGAVPELVGLLEETAVPEDTGVVEELTG